MKTIVVYKSKYGYTKKYAQWLAEELNCDIKENAELDDILNYDIIIFGGGMYAGGLNGSKLITKNLSKLTNKKLVLFAVGSNPGRADEIEAFWSRLLNEKQRGVIKCFYLRGGFDYGKLGKADKFLMNMLRKVLVKKDDLTDDDKGLLAAYETPVDFTDKENLCGILDYIKNIQDNKCK